MKTINNMKAMEMNEDMLEQVIGGEGNTREEHLKLYLESINKDRKTGNAVISSMITGALNGLTFGLFAPAKTAYELATGKDLFISDEPSIFDKIYDPEMC